MDIKIDSRTVAVFDLDDTLYYEFDYLASAYREIAGSLKPHDPYFYDLIITHYRNKINVFEWIAAQEEFKESATTESLLQTYRLHKPNITPRPGVVTLLERIRHKNGKIGLLTDGRSVTQRNKIAALAIAAHIDEIVISEEFGSAKPDVRNFKAFEKLGNKFIYIADNIKKDFLAPKKLGWLTIRIKGADKLIHQCADEMDPAYHADYEVDAFEEINVI